MRIQAHVTVEIENADASAGACHANHLRQCTLWARNVAERGRRQNHIERCIGKWKAPAIALPKVDRIADPLALGELAGHSKNCGTCVNANRSSGRSDPPRQCTCHCATSAAYVKRTLSWRNAKEAQILVAYGDLTLCPGAQFQPRRMLACLLTIQP